MKTEDRNWQLEHYAKIGAAYGDKHFTKPDSEFTEWILENICVRNPNAQRVAEIGAGTCVFSSLLGKMLNTKIPIACFEPVAELLEAAKEFDNIEPFCAGADDLTNHISDNTFDLIFSKDTAHHFSSESLDEVHQGICNKLSLGGRYLMIVRTPPKNPSVPVGEIASEKWGALYTPLSSLLKSLKRIDGWKELEITHWEKAVATPVNEWISGIQSRDTWSVFSALNDSEIKQTVHELTARFNGQDCFQFLHQYDVAMFEKL